MDNRSRMDALSLTGTETPLADALIRLSMLTKHSFHALPLLHRASIADSALRSKYDALYGTHLFGIELTTTGAHFDSFFFPDGVIQKAERLAARLFGADGTLFVTTGTTTSNQIAIQALYETDYRVLLDRSCHLSMHVALQTMHATVGHLELSQQSVNNVHSYWRPEELLAQLLDAQEQDDPYQLVILNGQSYDGLIYNTPAILEYLLTNGVQTRRFLIDEAWSSANYFDERTKHNCAMNISPLLDEHPDLVVVSTQSAHKTLSCMRQASMIHFRGEQRWRHSLNLSRFRTHTTSPSYPILASLDLARAQMEMHGVELIEQTRNHVNRFCSAITTDPTLHMYSLDEHHASQTPLHYAAHNPMKVLVNISKLSISPEEFRNRLLTVHGIYINRLTVDAILLNFHIGISALAVRRLLEGLREIGQKHVHSLSQNEFSSGTISDRFVIPYPPGVPLLVPGDPLDRRALKKLEDIRLSGISILSM